MVKEDSAREDLEVEEEEEWEEEELILSLFSEILLKKEDYKLKTWDADSRLKNSIRNISLLTHKKLISASIYIKDSWILTLKL